MRRTRKLSTGPDGTELETLGERIRRLRKDRKLKAPYLAKQMGITQRIFYYWEHGGTVPAEMVVPLCRAMGLTPNELLGWEAL